MKNIAVGQEVFLTNGNLGIYADKGKVLLADGSIFELGYYGKCYTVGDKILAFQDVYEILTLPTTEDKSFTAKIHNSNIKRKVKCDEIDRKIPAVGDLVQVKISYLRKFTVGEICYSYKRNKNIHQILVLSENKDCWFDLIEQSYAFVY